MNSLVDALNALLAKERGVVEATTTLVSELDRTDPDIAHSARDVTETARWACSGLYHRISQLGGTVTLDASDLREQLEDQPDTISKIDLICEQETEGKDMVQRILERSDVDQDTRGFLDDMLNAQCDTVNWCESTLGQWKVDT